MKKVKYFLTLPLITVLLSSCFKDIDSWHTNTSAYDGRFSIAVTCEEDNKYNAVINNGLELWIYNSAANVENEIIIDTKVAVVFDEKGEIAEAGFPIKGKFKITGEPSGFKGEDKAWNILGGTELNNKEYSLIINGLLQTPSSSFLNDSNVGEEFDAIQLYARISIEECKITPQGATTIGGNKSDGIYLKITTYCDYLVVESYETPQDTWANHNKPEYGWRVKEGSRANADGFEKHWTLEGYRYTGYPEDMVSQPQPPIIEK